MPVKTIVLSDSEIERMEQRWTELYRLSKLQLIDMCRTHYRIFSVDNHADKATYVAFLMEAEFGRARCAAWDNVSDDSGGRL